MLLFLYHNTVTKQNCKKIYNDLINCIDNKIQHKIGDLTQSNYPNLYYFDFTQCDEYEQLKKKYCHNVYSLNINLSELSYPYNRYYQITNTNNIINLRLFD
jgi:hypothetical protein